MAFVTIRIKGAEGYTRSTLDKDRMVLGRASASNLPIKHTSISREHCALVRETVDGGERWFVEDLGSANGTWVNKERLPVEGRKELAEKDVIKAGKARLTFHVGSLAEAEAAVELSAREEGGEEGADAPQRRVGADDPPEAIPCQTCNGWMSIAHRLAGETMACPRCGQTAIVPELVSQAHA